MQQTNLKTESLLDQEESMLKYGTTKVYNSLARIFLKCINDRNVPDKWETGYISIIFKMKNKSDSHNYRGISGTNTVSGVYNKRI